MKTLASTATMLGDWDLQSTLLRRTLQEGALRLPIAPETGEPILAESPEQLDNFQRGLVAASRGTRRDWASRYILPPVEEFATAELMKTGVTSRLADVGGFRSDACSERRHFRADGSSPGWSCWSCRLRSTRSRGASRRCG
jgi:hypothetical protein